MLPKVVIIGRPNVGKSSLLNLLAGRLVSIVDPTAGVTRDRIGTMAELKPAGDDDQPTRYVEIVDTGGYGIQDSQNLTAQVEAQIALGLAQANLVLFVVDAQSGILPLDRQVAQLLRESRPSAPGSKTPAPSPKSQIPNPKSEIPPAPDSSAESAKSEIPNPKSEILPVPGSEELTTKARSHEEDANTESAKSEIRHQKLEIPRAPARVLLIANKVDSEAQEAGAYEAMALGFGEPLMISASTARNKPLLVDAILANIDWDRLDDSTRPPDPGMLLAIIGKRNAGKSTLVNALAGEDRVIVSEIEGTTRDSVDVRFEMDDKVFTAIDTAGVRKSKSLSGDIEYYSYHRALRSLRRADVVMLMVDATVPISQVDKHLGMELQRHFKPTVIVVNKWDLAEQKATQDDYLKYLDKELQGLDFCPIVFVSAVKNEGVRETVAMALNLFAQSGHRVTTGELNRTMEVLLAENTPTSGIGRRPKIYYATQLAVHPPTIFFSVNDPSMFDASYQRFLINRFRDMLPFAEVPIKLIIRGREQSPKTAAGESSR